MTSIPRHKQHCSFYDNKMETKLQRKNWLKSGIKLCFCYIVVALNIHSGDFVESLYSKTK